MIAEWKLEGCCGTEEITFLCFYAGYVVAFFLFQSTVVLKPMRLLAVFIHEVRAGSEKRPFGLRHFCFSCFAESSNLRCTNSPPQLLFQCLSRIVQFGHASACWLTGGSVKGIEVESNEVCGDEHF